MYVQAISLRNNPRLLLLQLLLGSKPSMVLGWPALLAVPLPVPLLPQDNSCSALPVECILQGSLMYGRVLC